MDEEFVAKEHPYRVTFHFKYNHYGHPDQIETIRVKLEREIFLATSQPIRLECDSVIQIGELDSGIHEPNNPGDDYQSDRECDEVEDQG